MGNRRSVPSKTYTSMCYGTGRSLCSCSQQTLCYVSQTCPVPSPSSSLRSWCDPLVTWSAAFWCTAPPQGIPRAMALWSTWRRTLRPGPSQSYWESSWAPACCMSTGLRWAPSRTHCCTLNACVWTACPRAWWQPKISATPWLTLTHQSSARLKFTAHYVSNEWFQKDAWST